MVSWDKRRETQYFNFLINLAAACVVFYLLARHTLLVANRLKPNELGRGKCTRTCFAWIKSLVCGEQTTAERRKAKRADEKGAELHLKLIFYGTIGCMVWFLLYFINVLVIYQSSVFGWLPFCYCHYAVAFSGVTVFFARLCTYTVLVSRLFLGFDGSMYGYKQRTIYVIYALIAIFGSFITFFFVAFVRGNRIEYHSNGSKAHFCETGAPLYFFALIILGDMFFNILVLVLFVRALRQMLADSKQLFINGKKRAEDRKENADLYLLPLKYTLLTTVAVMTTMATWVLYSLTGAVCLVPIDCVVNCAALVFMTRRWKPVYYVICGPLLRCVAKSHCLPADFVHADLIKAISKRQPNLELVVKSVSADTGETASQKSSQQSTQVSL